MIGAMVADDVQGSLVLKEKILLRQAILLVDASSYKGARNNEINHSCIESCTIEDDDVPHCLVHDVESLRETTRCGS